MAIYYVDINNSYTTEGDGSSGNPFNYDQMIAITVESERTDTFKLRGQKNAAGEYVQFCDGDDAYLYSFVAWDLELYGPWRVNCEGFIAGSDGIITDGIVYSTDSVDFNYIRPSNMFVKILMTDFKYIYFVIAKGCTFIGCRFYGYMASLYDCVIDVVEDGPESYSYTNCVFSRSSMAGSKTDCQLGWTPPTWPAWDAPLSSFTKTLLNYGTMATPPKPGVGSPDYVGYTVNLSGDARDDIGIYTSESSTTTPAPVTTTPAPDIVRHFGGGPGQRKIILDETLSQHFRRPWGTMADYPYQP